jgi:hypothetical protein
MGGSRASFLGALFPKRTIVAFRLSAEFSYFLLSHLHPCVRVVTRRTLFRKEHLPLSSLSLHADPYFTPSSSFLTKLSSLTIPFPFSIPSPHERKIPPTHWSAFKFPLFLPASYFLEDTTRMTPTWAMWTNPKPIQPSLCRGNKEFRDVWFGRERNR